MKTNEEILIERIETLLGEAEDQLSMLISRDMHDDECKNPVPREEPENCSDTCKHYTGENHQRFQQVREAISLLVLLRS